MLQNASSIAVKKELFFPYCIKYSPPTLFRFFRKPFDVTIEGGLMLQSGFGDGVRIRAETELMLTLKKK